MPRSGPSGTYTLPPVYLAVPGTTILTQQHNVPLEDIATTFNTVQPVTYGGTGASSAAGARSELGILQGFGALTNIAGASTIDLGTISTNNANVTGSGWTCTSLGSTASTNPIFQLTFAGTGTITHNATSLILPGGANIAVAAGDSARLMYLGGGNWRLLTYSTGAIIQNPLPIGAVIPYGGTAAPSGWLLCYGQAVSRTTYAALFAVFSTTYGVGDGSTTFNMPDLRGRAVAGKDNMGGVSADRLTSPINGDNLGAAGGAESVTLTTNEIPSHQHSVTATSNDSASGGSLKVSSGGSSFTATNAAQATGGGAAHNNVQPTIVLNYIAFAGV